MVVFMLLGRLRRLLSILLLCALLSGCAYGNHIDQGDALYAKGDYEQAMVEYQSALKLKPESEEARGKLSDTKRRLGERFEKEARELLAQQDYLGAIAAAARAQEHADAAPGVVNLAREVSLRVQEHADTLATQRQWSTSIQLSEALYDAFPDDRAILDEKLAAYRQTWAADLAVRGQQAEQAKHPGDALLLYAQAAELTQGPVHIAKRDELLAMLVDTQSYNVLVKTQDGSQGNRVVASGLAGGASQLVRVLDDKLVKKGKVVAVTAKVGIGRPEFDTQRTSSTRVARYKSGTRQVPNPSYKSAQDRVLDAERDAQRYQDEINRLEKDLANYQQQVAREGDTPGTSTGAEQGVSRSQSSLGYARDNLSRAQNTVLSRREDLNRTPQTVEEDVYSDLQYTVTTHRLTAQLPITLRLEHADGRPAIELERVVATSASDDEHPAQPLANISADPLQLPSRDSLTSSLWSAGARIAQAAMTQSLDAHRSAILERGFKASDEGERMHYFVLYILLDPASVDPKIVEAIEQSRGIPDSPRLLMKR
jgi:tetratricopeptide (TPR) repeat protein